MIVIGIILLVSAKFAIKTDEGTAEEKASKETTQKYLYIGGGIVLVIGIGLLMLASNEAGNIFLSVKKIILFVKNKPQKKQRKKTNITMPIFWIWVMEKFESRKKFVSTYAWFKIYIGTKTYGNPNNKLK